MSNKICKEEQLKLSLGFKLQSPQPISNVDQKVINFNDYRSKKEKDFFLTTVDYLTKHLRE